MAGEKTRTGKGKQAAAAAAAPESSNAATEVEATASGSGTQAVDDQQLDDEGEDSGQGSFEEDDIESLTNIGDIVRHLSGQNLGVSESGIIALAQTQFQNNIERQKMRRVPTPTADELITLPRDMLKQLDNVVKLDSTNWASDANSDRKSTSGFCVFVNGCLVSWRSQLQRCVSLSAVEAELVAASEAARELMFLRNLLRETGLLSDDVPTLLTDSLGCTQVAQDPAHQWRLKHIDTRFYYLRDLVKSKELTVAHLPGVDNPADILTKAVGHHILDRHCKTLKLAGK